MGGPTRERPIALAYSTSGSVTQTPEGDLPGFACHPGHRFAATDVDKAQSREAPRVLTMALRMLNERAELARRLAAAQRKRGRLVSADAWDANTHKMEAALLAAPPPAASRDALRGVSSPTLVLVGAEMKALFPVIAEHVRECIPGAERGALPGVNHDAPVRDPAGFAATVSRFVSKH